MESNPEFTKEQLDAIKIVSDLYSLKSDCDKAFDFYFRNKNANQVLTCGIKRNEEAANFSHVVPSIFCDLVAMLTKGELALKKHTPTPSEAWVCINTETRSIVGCFTSEEKARKFVENSPTFVIHPMTIN